MVDVNKRMTIDQINSEFKGSYVILEDVAYQYPEYSGSDISEATVITQVMKDEKPGEIVREMRKNGRHCFFMRVLSDADKNADIEYSCCFGKPFEGGVLK